MSCLFCKGDIEDKNTTFMVDLDNTIVIVKNVPSHVCEQCGEVSYGDEVMEHLQAIMDSVRTAITEIAVVNYAERVA